MPYITPTDREKYRNLLLTIQNIPEISSKGELEFIIFTLMKKYMSTRKECYTELHNCVYSAIHCGDEFRRRYLDDRENKARKENGDC